VYSVELKSGEQFIAHPSNILGYTVNQKPPRPYRFKSSSLRLQVPSLDLGRLVPDTKFFRVMRESETWKGISLFLFTLRTWSRRTIWGDRVSFEDSAQSLKIHTDLVSYSCNLKDQPLFSCNLELHG
jgi:hypothetical protein